MFELPKVANVSAGNAPFTIVVTWADKTRSKVDMTGLVARSKHFGVFRDDPKGFREVRPTEFGGGIEWDNGLDYGADTLKLLADEQKVLTGRDLARFEDEFRLNAEELAHVFEVTTRSISNWRRFSRKALPATVAMALRTFRRDPTAFMAHYRPIEVKPRGRPKSAASKRNSGSK